MKQPNSTLRFSVGRAFPLRGSFEKSHLHRDTLALGNKVKLILQAEQADPPGVGRLEVNSEGELDLTVRAQTNLVRHG